MPAIKMFGKDIPVYPPVITWQDPGGFDGYTTKAFEIYSRKNGSILKKKGRRIGRSRAPDEITQIVIHHSGGDGPNPSGMYQTLWFNRFLSVHFALEDDGRIYQFVDAQEIAWHAGGANGKSIGIECCLFPLVKADPYYYSADNCARRKNLPHEQMIQTIQHKKWETYRMPDQQVDALANLCAALWYGLGNTESPKFPRDDKYMVPTSVLSRAVREKHKGLLGHYHLTDQKWDPAGIDLGAFEAKCSTIFKTYVQKG